MKRPNIVYFSAQPSSIAAEVLGRAVDRNPDAVVLLTYDSGRVPNDYLTAVRKATKRGIPVFGIRERILSNVEFDPIQTRDGLALYELDPPALEAGLIPLQGYPFQMSKFADNEEDLIKKSYDIIEGMNLKVNVGSLKEYIATGMIKICSAHGSYRGKVEEARKRFSTPEFDDRVYQMVKKPKMKISLVLDLFVRLKHLKARIMGK